MQLKQVYLLMDNANQNTYSPASDFPNCVVLRTLQQLLESKFPTQSFSYELLPATKKGENYIGILYRVVVKVETNLGTSFSSLVLKVPPRSLVRRKQFFIRPCFLRESLAYEEFLPMVEGFQKNKGISTENSFCEFVKCLYTITDEFEEAIFLEDLRFQGYRLFDRFDDFKYDHVVVVMRIYAKLHAVSFALKDQSPGSLEKFQVIEDIFEQRKSDPNLIAYFEGLKKSTEACLGNQSDMYKEILSRFFKRPFFDIYLNFIDGKKSEPHSVVCHGDCWSNNIMFKFKDDKVESIRLLDWQLLRYSSPITDLMYFLFTCTSKEFRKVYYSDMINVYYEELFQHISRLGSDPSKLFPREKFNEELMNKGAVGLLFAMIVLPIITIKAEDVPNLEDLSKRVETGEIVNLKESGLLCEGNSDSYCRRMRDVVVDCIDFGYIKT